MKKVTVYDVVVLAGVSVTTVSRVLNHPESVKEATREKIFQAMDELGYEYVFKIPETSRDERGGQEGSRLILVIVPYFTNPFHSTALDGIKTAAQNRGYDIVIYNYDHNDFLETFERLLDLIDKLPVCGGVLLSPGIQADKIQLLDQKLPVVQCADIAKEVSYVAVDDYAAAKSAVNYLLRHGGRKIAFIKTAEMDFVRNRERGYCDAMKEAGLPVVPQDIVSVPEDYETAVALISGLLGGEDRPDAFFASSDLIAVAAVNAVSRKGLRVPEDVSVVGFDDTYLAAMSTPPLTTVRQPIRRMGEIACKMLLDRLANPSAPCEQILLNADLVVRGTTRG